MFGRFQLASPGYLKIYHYISTIVAKLTEMQQELRDSKRSLKESQAEKEAYENKYNDVLDSMEVTLLDKEMAEERAENLQHEVNMLKEKVDEMHVDLNVFQQEEGKLFCTYILAHGQMIKLTLP